MRFYVLHVVGDTDPDLLGPFATAGQRDDKAAELFKENGLEDGVFGMDVDEEGAPTVFPYSSQFSEKAIYGDDEDGGDGAGPSQEVKEMINWVQNSSDPDQMAQACEELFEICDREHASCNDECPVYFLNGHKTVEDPDDPDNCLCFKLGSKMFDFIRNQA